MINLLYKPERKLKYELIDSLYNFQVKENQKIHKYAGVIL